MSALVIVGNIACSKPATRQGAKLLNLMARQENVRRTPALWGNAPDYGRAIETLKARMQ